MKIIHDQDEKEDDDEEEEDLEDETSELDKQRNERIEEESEVLDSDNFSNFPTQFDANKSVKIVDNVSFTTLNLMLRFLRIKRGIFFGKVERYQVKLILNNVD